jgi:hypothetical protein
MRSDIILSPLLLLSLAACSTTHGDRIDPSGAYPDAKTGNVVHEKTDFGTLIVATPEDRVDSSGRHAELPHGGMDSSTHTVNTGYGIYNSEGKLVAEVPNHSDLVVTSEGPTEIALPAGRYLVRLDRDDVPVRTFWVTIEPRKRTEVDPKQLGGVEEPNVR